MMSKPKYFVIFTGLFCSVVAGVLRTLTRLSRKCFGKGLFFGMKTMAFGLGKPSPGQKTKICCLRPYHVENTGSRSIAEV